MTKPLIREATFDDLDYFVSAGRKYAETIGFLFDEEIYRSSIVSLIESPLVICHVIPAKAHCAIMLTQSMFGNEIIAKVFTTWGRGGTKCFKSAMRVAKEMGASKIIADANLSPQIVRFYEGIGLKQYDTNYMGNL